jgi:hypothetical protein
MESNDTYHRSYYMETHSRGWYIVGLKSGRMLGDGPMAGPRTAAIISSFVDVGGQIDAGVLHAMTGKKQSEDKGKTEKARRTLHAPKHLTYLVTTIHTSRPLTDARPSGELEVNLKQRQFVQSN